MKSPALRKMNVDLTSSLNSLYSSCDGLPEADPAGGPGEAVDLCSSAIFTSDATLSDTIPEMHPYWKQAHLSLELSELRADVPVAESSPGNGLLLIDHS